MKSAVKIWLLWSLGLALFVVPAWAQTDRSALERPFLVGPHYPLAYRTTTFEPDRAFNLKSGQSMVQLSYTRLNSYVFSDNNDKADNPEGDASVFHATDDQGYSVYFDGEIDRRFFRWYYGLSDGLELQLTYRDLRFIPGNLDSQIEGFHRGLGIGNQGRDQTERDQLEIYLFDNRTGELVFVLTEGNEAFQRESMTLGLKFALRQTASEAIAFTVSSNFGDGLLDQELNEVDNPDEEEHRNFDDLNYSLLYSSKFTDFSLHGGFSLAQISHSTLSNGPSEMYYFFLGGDWAISENWHGLIQALEYTSPFPPDNSSSISADVREVTLGLRIFMGPTALELGFIENQSQGPQNIDIAFFSNFMFSF